MSLRHTPYLSVRHRPFTVGLQPLDLDAWIEPDEQLGDHLAEKHRLLESRRHDVVALADDTEAAQREVLDLILAHLEDRFPDRYRMADGKITIPETGACYEIADWSRSWLELAARLVQEDLCVMRKRHDRHTLAAAVVCFPSSWSLAEKFGRPLEDIHEPVPGIDTRMSTGIERIFDNLKCDHPVWRLNWSISGDPSLHHPARNAGKRPALDRERDIGGQLYIRVERQTLRRLPESGDILFTIRIHIDRMSDLACHPHGPALAAGLKSQLLAMSDAELDYKGLLDTRGDIAEYLAIIAG